MPVKAGIHLFFGLLAARRWIPARAGMTTVALALVTPKPIAF